MKVILFDLDGTLIDSTEAILESFKITLNKLGGNYNENKIKELIGLPLDLMFLKLGIDEEKIDEYVNNYKQHYRKISTQKTKLLPYTEEAIKFAYSFAQLGIVTTKTSKYSKELLEHFNILKYFKVVIGREDVINPKPHSEPIIKALKYFDNYKYAWMIGDTCLDIISATEAGIESIGVEFEYEKNLKKCAKIIKKNIKEAVYFCYNK